MNQNTSQLTKEGYACLDVVQEIVTSLGGDRATCAAIASLGNSHPDNLVLEELQECYKLLIRREMLRLGHHDCRFALERQRVLESLFSFMASGVLIGSILTKHMPTVGYVLGGIALVWILLSSWLRPRLEAKITRLDQEYAETLKNHS